MTKECLEMIYSEVKDKSQRMNMWPFEGSQKARTGKLKGKYLSDYRANPPNHKWHLVRRKSSAKRKDIFVRHTNSLEQNYN